MPDSHVHHVDVETDPHKSHPMVIPGDAEEVADEIQSVSPDGRPADSKMGPAGLHWLLVLAGLGILLVSVLVAVTIDPAAGVVMLLVGGVAFVFSPGFFVAWARATEREEVSRTMSDREEDHPQVIVMKNPPRAAKVKRMGSCR